MFRQPAHVLNELFIKGEYSATEIATVFLERMALFEPHVHAFLHQFPEKVLQKAKMLDEKRALKKPLGKLAGVPIAVKDNIHVKGELSTCGSKFLSNYRAPFESTAVRHLQEEDALIIGKTNCDEFAMGSSTENSAFGPTKNPWDLSCSPGGSSGGSSAAVAARFCAIALGSDTGGSIRQPAAFTGTVGFKPTYGRVSRYGLVAFGSSLDQIGPMTHNVTDAALAMQIMGKYCPHDATSLNVPSQNYLDTLDAPLEGATIGVPWRFLESLSPEAKDNFQQSLDVYRELGVSTVDIDLDILKHSIAVYYILATAEASTNLARFDGIRYGLRSQRAKTLDQVFEFSREEGFGPEVKRRILLGTFVLSSGYQDAYYKKAQKVRTLIIEAFNTAFKKCDMIAMPTYPFPAFALGSIQDPLQMYLADIYTTCANLAGIPAISIPSGFSKDNKPLGIQLLGPQLQDGKVLTFARGFEKLTSFHNTLPPLEAQV